MPKRPRLDDDHRDDFAVPKLSDADSSTSNVTTVSELENDQRNMNFNAIKKSFKYVDQAVQSYVTAMVKVHLLPEVKAASFATLTANKSNKQKCQIRTADELTLGDGVIR